MKSAGIALVLGLVYGWIISRSGIAQFEHITGMFSLTDFHMFGVLGVAVPVAGLIKWLLKGRPTLNGEPFALTKKVLHRGNYIGGMIFGAGWAVTGACPGTSLGQLGTLHWGAIFTLIGIAIGVLLYRPVNRHVFKWSTDSCG